MTSTPDEPDDGCNGVEYFVIHNGFLVFVDSVVPTLYISIFCINQSIKTGINANRFHYILFVLHGFNKVVTYTCLFQLRQRLKWNKKVRRYQI
jgi:hypothetical protein